MQYIRIEIDGSYTKRTLVEKINLISEPFILVPMTEECLNLVFFVADIFRRNGKYVNILANNNENLGINVMVVPFPGTVEDIQITRDDSLTSLKNNINDICRFKIIRACGTSISKAWLYSKHLCDSGKWFHCNNININAIPVKIEEKNIYKTTICVMLQKLDYPTHV